MTPIVAVATAYTPDFRITTGARILIEGNDCPESEVHPHRFVRGIGLGSR